jgi:transcriptional regulator with XRE-family HTH domain
MAKPDSIASRLATVRTAGGLSAAKLSRLADLADSHVGLIERGTVKDPGGIVMTKIANVLGVSVEWLVNGGERATDEAIRAHVEAFEAARANEGSEKAAS